MNRIRQGSAITSRLAPDHRYPFETFTATDAPDNPWKHIKKMALIESTRLFQYLTGHIETTDSTTFLSSHAQEELDGTNSIPSKRNQRISSEPSQSYHKHKHRTTYTTYQEVNPRTG
jgi:hypothetical protein